MHVRFLHTLAIGGVTIVLTAVLMTLTLLPALLLLVGERVNWPRRFSRRSRGAGTLWGRWAHEAMVRPWRYLVPSVIVLAVLIVPTVRLKAWNVGAHDLSPEMEARQGYDQLERNFAAGWMGPIAVLVERRDKGSVVTQEAQQAIGATYARLAADPRVVIARGMPNSDGRATVILLVPRSAPESKEVMTFVRELRVAPWTEAHDANLDVRVGGFSAGIIDFDEELFRSVKRVVPLVLAITFIVLMVAFRSRPSR